jgi:hypothetical protein
MSQLDPGYDGRLVGFSSFETAHPILDLTDSQQDLYRRIRSAIPSKDSTAHNVRKIMNAVRANPATTIVLLDGRLEERINADGNNLVATIEARRDDKLGDSGCDVYTIASVSINSFNRGQ